MWSLMKQSEDMPFPDIPDKSGKRSLVFKSSNKVFQFHDLFNPKQSDHES